MQNNSKESNIRFQFTFICYIFILTLLLYSLELHSQTKSNLEIFYTLADSAAINAVKNIPADETNVKLDFGTGNIYSIFNNKLMESFQKAGKTVLNGPKYDSTAINVSFRIDKTNIGYGELFQKNLFGDFYTERQINISGNYILFFKGMISHNFQFSYSDTVNVTEIKNIENIAFPFTQGKIPTEPLLTSIYEPVIGLGAAALTVILFFTVRSK
ncbi:MAG: hypothetical protein WCA84_12440 [Ignavibacteriaceae bacterium]